MMIPPYLTHRHAFLTLRTLVHSLATRRLIYLTTSVTKILERPFLPSILVLSYIDIYPHSHLAMASVTHQYPTP